MSRLTNQILWNDGGHLWPLSSSPGLLNAGPDLSWPGLIFWSPWNSRWWHGTEEGTSPDFGDLLASSGKGSEKQLKSSQHTPTHFAESDTWVLGWVLSHNSCDPFWPQFLHMQDDVVGLANGCFQFLKPFPNPSHPSFSQLFPSMALCFFCAPALFLSHP